MSEYYIGQIFETGYPMQAAEWCEQHNSYIDEIETIDGNRRFEIKALPSLTPEQMLKEYDDAMEQYLYQTRFDRGYNTREPDVYFNSSVPRWKQDAADWIAFRDQVMNYALQVQNDYNVTGTMPSLEDFIANMPVIHWSSL